MGGIPADSPHGNEGDKQVGRVKLPYELMDELSTTIINEVKGVNRVVYDISSKPPATIEWE